MAAYQERVYRLVHRGRGLVSFTVRVKESDLWIAAEHDLTDQALEATLRLRRSLEAYLASRPRMLAALTPLPPDPLAPPLVKAMLAAAQAAGTGPMAAVAGAIAQAVGRDLLEHSGQVVVENGGDLFLSVAQPITVGIWAGSSPLSGRLGLAIAPQQTPLALATSSGTVGHSYSAGKADAATVLAKDGALADAVATELGNRLKRPRDLAPALEWAKTVPGVRGALAVMGERLAAWGEMDLKEVKTPS